MTNNPRPGFEVDRKLTLCQDSDDGVILDATPAERIAMVWPLTQDCWSFVRDLDENAQREFQRHIERVGRRGG